MHLTRRPPRAMAVATRWDTGDLVDWYAPRAQAQTWLAGKICEGAAGIDPYDASVFILQAGPNEPVWARRAIELCGIVLAAETGQDGCTRFRAVLEADVRMELGLDGETPPLMRDEPLASRGVDAAVVARDLVAPVYDFASYGVTAAIAAIEKPKPEPVSLTAMRDAKAAYDARYPEGA